MEILLINSPLFRNNNLSDEDILPPLGLGYIATYLMLQNIDVKIIDAIINNISFSNLKNILNEAKPNFIGINIFATNYKIVKDLIEAIDFKTHIIIGGLSTKSLFKKIIQWETVNQIDIVIGDGELITADIINNSIKEDAYFENKNRRVYNINNSSMYFIRDISNSHINRDLFINEPTTNFYGDYEINLVTSRGCIYNCTFCAAACSLNKDYAVRERSTNSIIKELNDIKKGYPDTVSIRILDDLFLKSKDSFRKAIEVFSKFDFKWRSMAHIKTFNNIEQETLIGLKKSGCTELFIGIESGSPRILHAINKTHDIDLIVGNFKKIFQCKINIKAYFIYGFPDETINDMEMTYNLVCRLKEISTECGSNFRTSVFQFRPYHGTIIYNSLKEKYPDINIENVIPNRRLTKLIGRKQFNFYGKNYSKVSLKIIHDYICKTNMI